MRWRPILAAVLFLGLAGPTTAQEAPAPDVPAGDATLEGRVVDAADGGVADVGVILYSLRPDGEPGLRQSRTDAEGGFVFEGIAGDPEVVYLVGTRVAGVPFGARVVFEPGEKRRRVEVEVAQPSPDASRVVAGEPGVRLERGCSHLRVHHEHTLSNPTSTVVFVPPDARDGAEPIFALELPERATGLEMPVGATADGFDREGRTLRFYGPVYPGSSTVEFSYGIPLEAASSLAIGFPDGADAVRVLVPPSGVDVSTASLEAEGETPLPSGPHRSLRSGPIEPGGSLLLDLALGDAESTSAVEISEARLWLELDDAALDVSEVYQLRVEGDEPVAASTPLLCIPLPPGAESLRFSNASLSMGLSRDPEGALALQGPIPAGDSSLSLRYVMPAQPGTVPFRREFDREVDLLTLLVADTGIVPHTERLHRRRPIRTEDRSYLHLEGFAIEAGQPVEVELRPLPQRQGLSSLATSGIVLVIAAGALFYLVAPLRSGPERAPARDQRADGDAASRLARERETIYAAIDDLDEDFETGKVSAEDHGRMRGELRARAVALLQAERDAATAKTTPPPEERPVCSGCGATASVGDRFCSQCGTALSPAAGAAPARGSAAS